jgi:hypothetical protein
LNNLAENTDNNMGENRVNYNFKKKEKNNKDIKEDIGIKKYEDDYDEKELINLYDKNQIKDNIFHLNYNKEKLNKIKLKKEHNLQNNENNNNDNQ